MLRYSYFSHEKELFKSIKSSCMTGIEETDVKNPVRILLHNMRFVPTKIILLNNFFDDPTYGC